MKNLLGSKTLGLCHHKQQVAHPVFREHRTYISNCRNILIKHLKYIYEKRILKSEDTPKDLWESTKQNNIHIIGAPEEEEEDKKNYLNK